MVDGGGDGDGRHGGVLLICSAAGIFGNSKDLKYYQSLQAGITRVPPAWGQLPLLHSAGERYLTIVRRLTTYIIIPACRYD